MSGESSKTGAESVRWDLTHLYANPDDLTFHLIATEEKSESFAQRYHGQLASLDANGLALCLREYADLLDALGRASTYAYLDWSTRTTEAEAGKLLQSVREETTRIYSRLLFFDLEWIALSEESSGDLIRDPVLSRYRHYLEVTRLRKPHVLSEGEERILVEKDVTGASAWSRFFDETLGAASFPFRDVELPEQLVLSKLHDGDRDVRRDAAIALTAGLEQNARSLTFVFNTILADKASSDRLRSYGHWLDARNLSNEVGSETVEALIDSVVGRYDLVARYYTLKRLVLGLDVLFDYDRYAPIGESDTRYTWEQARELVLSAYSAFHPDAGRIARRFFDEGWIDAPVVAGKRGGAYSHGAVPSAHPYVFLNFSGKVRDVQTLAHELGHGVHQYLSRTQGVLHADTPLTTAETASVFGEMLVFQELLDRDTTEAGRLAMLMGKIDDTIATVYRQVAMNRFEDRIHTARRSSGELSADEFGDVWLETQRDMFGGSVELGDHYRSWWSYIPHFLHTPGYVYAYAFGELLVLALYSKYRSDPAGFPTKYMDMLQAGGSDWPHVLVGKLGADLEDPAFWREGLGEIEALIVRAEKLAARAGFELDH